MQSSRRRQDGKNLLECDAFIMAEQVNGPVPWNWAIFSFAAHSTDLRFLSKIMVNKLKEVYHEHLGRILVR